MGRSSLTPCGGRWRKTLRSFAPQDSRGRLSPHKQTLEFFGVGGDRMRAAGCDTIVDTKDLAVVGITEILSHLPQILGLYRHLIAEADKRKPDLAIVIDSPAFNWRVARQMKKRGIPDGLLRCAAVLGVASGTRAAAARLHRQGAGDLPVRREVLPRSWRGRDVRRPSASGIAAPSDRAR